MLFEIIQNPIIIPKIVADVPIINPTKKKILTKKQLSRINMNIFKEIDSAFEFSYKSKFPGKKYIYKHVYKKEF